MQAGYLGRLQLRKEVRQSAAFSGKNTGTRFGEEEGERKREGSVAWRVLLKTGDAGMELSKRRIRRTTRRLGMAIVNELEKRVAVCRCT